MSTLETIPQPPEKPLLGNILELGPSTQVQDLIRLAREYGPIYQLALPGRRLVVVSSFELADELCDETRFDKKIWAPLQNVRGFTGDGLFTAHTQEANWHKAHNILLPNFGLKAMQSYHPMMLDIAHQLVERLDRLNSDDEVDVPDLMTRLTLDTIGLCGFDYRFNSFYRDAMHPFVHSMVQALDTALKQLVRPEIGNKLNMPERHRFQKDVELMNTTVDRIIKERRESGAGQPDKADLLHCMLTGVDKDSGQKLDDLNIRYQIITFLIAGHETTSGMLSFAFYFLLNHPEVLAKAYEEVDRVLGRDLAAQPTFRQVNELKYISQILKESLRLWPTAPMFALYPYEPETVIGGRYQVTQEDDIAVLTPILHRDKTVWGEQADRFNPDNFSPEAEADRPANAYKPFGNGQRACIGRQFAMQEAILVLGMMLQRYHLIDHSHYELKVKETLTLKPDNFKLKIRQRPDTIRTAVAAPPQAAPTPATEAATRPALPRHHTPLLVLYGSNMGTAEGLAHQIGDDGTANGFTVTVAPLDDYTDKLPKEGAVMIVASSYNGTPPDNARKFYSWLTGGGLSAGAFQGVRYALFGCGNRDWAATYQAIPRTIDQRLSDFGATRIGPRGEGNAADDFDGDFQGWYQPFWTTTAEALMLDLGVVREVEKGHLYNIEVIDERHPNPFVASFEARPMVIIENRELQNPASERSTRHIELALPEGVTYQTGEHLGVIAQNHTELVRRVTTLFGFNEQTRIKIRQNGHGKTNFPLDQAISVSRLLTTYVELQDVATRKQIKTLADFTPASPDKHKLLALAGEDEPGKANYRDQVLNKHKSVLDLLEECPACELPFNVYLEMLAPLRPRYYSISSSPLQYRHICSLTVGVVEAPARSGHGKYQGICSNYLAGKGKGSTIYAFVRDTESEFRLPKNPRIPLIMIGPGTGLAPFRGFLQERAALKAQGQPVGQSILFFGCRNAEHDFIYRTELETFAEQGVTELVVAFSRVEGQPKTYVQHKLMEHQDAIWQMLETGAIIYICGDAGKTAPDVRRAFAAIYREKTGQTEEQAEAWLNDMADSNRYLLDVWASS